MFSLHFSSLIVSNILCPNDLLLLVLVLSPGPGGPGPLPALVTGVPRLPHRLPGGEDLDRPGRDTDVLWALTPTVVDDVDLSE